MRKFGEYDLSRLSDSRILYMRKPPKFMPIFVVIVVAILVGGGVWSAIAVKSQEVKAAGMIAAEGKYPVAAESSGTISSIYFQEGDTVNAGDIILDFDTAELDIRIAKLLSDLEKVEDRIGYIELMLDAIRADPPQNPIVAADDLELYLLFEEFLVEFGLIGSDNASKRESLIIATEQKLAIDNLSSIAERDSVASEIAMQEIMLSKLRSDLQKTADRMGYIDLLLAEVDAASPQNPIGVTDDAGLYQYFEGFLLELSLIGKDNDDKRESLRLSAEQALAGERRTSENDRDTLVAEIDIQNEVMDKLDADLNKAEARMAIIALLVAAADAGTPVNPITTAGDKEKYADLYQYFESFLLELSLIGKDNDDKRESLRLSAEQALAGERRTSENDRDTLVAEIDIQNEVMDKLSADLSKAEARIAIIALLILAADAGTPVNPITSAGDKEKYADLYQYFESFLLELSTIGKENNDKKESLRLSAENALANERKTSVNEQLSLESDIVMQELRLDKLEVDLTKAIARINNIDIVVNAINQNPPPNPTSLSAIETEDWELYMYYRDFYSRYNYPYDPAPPAEVLAAEREGVKINALRTLATEKQSSTNERNTLLVNISLQEEGIKKLKADLQRAEDRIDYIDMLLVKVRDTTPQKLNDLSPVDLALYLYFNSFVLEFEQIGKEDNDKRQSARIAAKQAFAGENKTSETDRDALISEIAAQNIKLNKLEDDLQKTKDRIGYVDLLLQEVRQNTPHNPITETDDLGLYHYFNNFLLEFGLIGKDDGDKRESTRIAAKQALAGENKTSETDRDALISEIAAQNIKLEKLEDDLQKTKDRIGYVDLLLQEVRQNTPHNPITETDDLGLYHYFNNFLLELGVIGNDNDDKRESAKISAKQALAGENKTSKEDLDALTAEIGMQDEKNNKLKADLAKAEARIGYISFMSAELRSTFPQNRINVADDRALHLYFDNFILELGLIGSEDDDKRESLRLTAGQNLAKDLRSNENEKDDIEVNIEAQETARSKYFIRSAIGGILHYDTDVFAGITLQIGTVIGSISDPDEKKIIEMYIPSGERSRIEEGQECRFTVDGLAQTEYGSIKGKVKSISDDAIVKDNYAVFKVVVEFDADHITDSKGNEVKLENGMTVTAWITYEKVTYMKYYADQLGLGDIYDRLFNRS
ncbi:MAG: HlyD family efflux transporter periplasmic adaptor subunit [Methanomassiliicoccaceae archaeon]|nr:HlyD family efflux transporter periplasmic adaptor subunit [Methanomassiliicoccaceae archaeon]